MEKQILYKFFSGETSQEETKMVLDWIDKAEENKAQFLRERKLYDAILVSDDDTLKNISIEKESKMISFLKKIAQVAAIFAIAISLSNLYFSNKIKQQELTVTMNTITVPAGQRVNLILGDGTEVWLNARTTLHYPTSFAGDTRHVILDGEANFKVSKNEQHPFIVETKKYNVEVLGTQFNLQAYSENEVFETALMEGSIKVASVDNPNKQVTLTPNQILTEIDGKLNVSNISDYDIFRWKEGLICFKDQTFKQIVFEFEKTYGVTIEVKNKKVLERLYTGKFRQSDGVSHALRVLQLSIPFKFQRDDEKNIIYII